MVITRGTTIAEIYFAAFQQYMPHNSFKAEDVIDANDCKRIIDYLFAGYISKVDVRALAEDLCNAQYEYLQKRISLIDDILFQGYAVELITKGLTE